MWIGAVEGSHDANSAQQESVGLGWAGRRRVGGSSFWIFCTCDVQCVEIVKKDGVRPGNGIRLRLWRRVDGVLV